MLTTLLANRKQVEVKTIGAKPLIEVIGEETNSSNEELPPSSQDGDDVFKVEEKQFDWTKHGASCTNYVRIVTPPPHTHSHIETITLID